MHTLGGGELGAVPTFLSRRHDRAAKRLITVALRGATRHTRDEDIFDLRAADAAERQELHSAPKLSLPDSLRNHFAANHALHEKIRAVKNTYRQPENPFRVAWAAGQVALHINLGETQGVVAQRTAESDQPGVHLVWPETAFRGTSVLLLPDDRGATGPGRFQLTMLGGRPAATVGGTIAATDEARVLGAHLYTLEESSWLVVERVEPIVIPQLEGTEQFSRPALTVIRPALA